MYSSQRFLLTLRSRAERRQPKYMAGLCMMMLTIGAGLLLCCGCGEKRPPRPIKTQSANNPIARQQVVSELSETVANWDDMFDADEQRKLVLNRLNDWRQAADNANPAVNVNWVAEPILRELPAELQVLPSLQNLDRPRFDVSDVDYLREATWLNFIARRARQAVHLQNPAAESPDPLAVATELFDWTIKNIALEWPSGVNPQTNPAMATMWQITPAMTEIMHTPYVYIFNGRGSALARAWVFVTLARQAKLEAVLLAVPDDKSPEGVRTWGVAVLHKKSADGPVEAYLFDPVYGLPIPGPQGQGIAMLSQILAEPALFEQLNAVGQKYPLQAADLSRVIALVEASPDGLSKRMSELQSDLPERLRRILAVRPGVTAELARGVKGIDEVRLWRHPFRVALVRAAEPEKLLNEFKFMLNPFEFSIPLPEQGKTKKRNEELSEYELMEKFQIDPETGQLKQTKQPDLQRKMVKPLQRGRLKHLSGDYGGSGDNLNHSANGDGRPAAEATQSPLDELGAIYWYLQCLMSREEEQRLVRDQGSFFYDLRRNMNLRATLGLGLIQADKGEYAAAVRYFTPDSNRSWLQWRGAADYNRARTEEAWGQSLLEKDPAAARAHFAAAHKLYQDDASPQRFGNLVRAERLAKMLSESSAAAPQKAK